MLLSPSRTLEPPRAYATAPPDNSLFGPEFPCSGAQNSLFRAEQGIGRNALIGRHNEAHQTPKWPRIRADFANSLLISCSQGNLDCSLPSGRTRGTTNLRFEDLMNRLLLPALVFICAAFS